MASNLKTVYLDFYGLPGSGKTTLLKEVVAQLREQGYSVATPGHDIVHHLSTKKRKVKKISISGIYSFVHPRKAMQICSLIKENGYGLMQGMAQYINVALNLFFFESCWGKYDYAIFDQGITQAAISLAVNGEESAQRNKEKIEALLDKKIQVIPLYVKEEKDVVLERLSNRTMHGSRVEKEPNLEKKKQLLCIFEEKCNEIKTDQGVIYAEDFFRQ